MKEARSSLLQCGWRRTRAQQNGRWRLIACLLMCLPMLAESAVKAERAYVRGLPPGQTITAAFMTLYNESSDARVLSGVSVSFARRAEIHQHSHHEGMMRMRRVERLVIEGNSEQLFEPGGYHIMIFGLDRTLSHGEQLPLVLQFDDGEQVTVMATVRDIMEEAKEK